MGNETTVTLPTPTPPPDDLLTKLGALVVIIAVITQRVVPYLSHETSKKHSTDEVHALTGVVATQEDKISRLRDYVARLEQRISDMGGDYSDLFKE
jgi:hypothetical protein